MRAPRNLLPAAALLTAIGLASCGGSNNSGIPDPDGPNISAAEAALGADNLPPGSADISVSGLAAADLPPQSGALGSADLPPI